MIEPRNRVVQVRRFGGPDELEVIDAAFEQGIVRGLVIHQHRGRRYEVESWRDELDLFSGHDYMFR